MVESVHANDVDTLVRDNLDLAHRAVAKIAGRLPRHVNRDDLLSAALAGLADAARLYDHRRPVPFERYASVRIAGAVLDELRRLDWATRGTRDKGRRVERLAQSLEAELGRQPTPRELAAAAEISVRELNRLRSELRRSVVLSYETLLEGGDVEQALPVADGDLEEQVLLHERLGCLATAMSALPARLQAVVRGYFFEERPMTDIAKELGVTESRVSQMRGEALELLRDGMNAQLDPSKVAPLPPRRGRKSRQAVYRAAVACAV